MTTGRATFWLGRLAGVASLAALVACQDVPTNGARAVPTAWPTSVAPSAASQEIGRYYTRVQNDLLVRGLLRTDGGGPDTPYTAETLASNFQRIAFFREYLLGAGIETKNRDTWRLSRWASPVRIEMIFGASVLPERRAADRDYVRQFASRLARVTGHPISVVSTRGNFQVFVLGEDDRAAAMPHLMQLRPSATATDQDLFRNMPRDVHCLMTAKMEGYGTPNISSALAIIRNEHPDRMRAACFHEEIAQGLGLLNDSPEVRPSIFNDDDEFALLTSHDELLLGILYDPRLVSGMSATQAMPIVRQVARDKYWAHY